MRTTVVIPTYNERENIERLIRALMALHIADFHILVVDDASPDGTAEEVELLGREFPGVSVLKRPGKMGLGSAYVEGFTRALAEGADVVVQMDADLSHDPADVVRLCAALAEGADIAIGSRRIAGGAIVGWNWKRHVASKGAQWVARFLLGLTTRDITSGFRAFRRSVLAAIHFADVRSNGYAFQEEMLLRSERGRFVIREVPVAFVDRQHGVSKLGMKDILEFFVIMGRLWKKK
jgi:dolichol-phosphate mannosyltransferase